MEQRSPEWYQVRRNKFTASEAGAFLVEQPSIRITIEEICKILTEHGIEHDPKAKKEVLAAKLPNRESYLDYTQGTKTARFNLICAKLSELGAEQLPEFDTFATRRGIELEPGARDYFEELTGLPVQQVGFIEHDSGLFGSSPDGLVKDMTEGLEIKCPLPATHVRYLLQGTLPEEYVYQIHTGMAASGFDRWHFFSFCPGLPALHVIEERTDLTAKVEAGFLALGAEYKARKAEMAQLYRETFQAA